jgi:hypothetical protein
MSIRIIRWRCQHVDCSRVAQGVGSPRALRVIGWHAERESGEDKLILFCPEHHPLGARAALEEARRLATVAGIAASVGDILDGAAIVSETVRGWIPTEED